MSAITPSPDTARDHAASVISAALADPRKRPVVKSFFDNATFTVSHVVHDPATKKAVLIDSVLDFDQPSGRTSHASADALIAWVQAEDLTIEWLLETHAHADHLSAAPYLQERLGGRLAIGHEILTVQDVFGKIFNEGTEFRRDGSQFDQLFNDGDRFTVGSLATHPPVWPMLSAMRSSRATPCSCRTMARPAVTSRAGMRGPSIARSSAC